MGDHAEQASPTLLIGVDEALLEPLKALIQANCCAREQVVNVAPMEAAPGGPFLGSPVKVPVGGAVAFVMEVDEFVRY